MFNRKQFSEDLFMFRTAKGLSRATAAKEIGIYSATMQGLEEARQEAAEKAKQVWKDYYGVDYINRKNEKNQLRSNKERGLI